MNPFAQSSWNSKQSPHPPSLLGALPYTIPPPDPRIVSFVFTYECDILNSIVLGPQGVQYYTISTDFRRPSAQTTAVQNSTSGSVGRIDWSQRSALEWRNVIPRQKTSEFLKLNGNSVSRLMKFNGSWLQWAPNHNYLSLYSGSSRSDDQMLARVRRTPQSSTVLEVTTQALSSGLMDHIVFSTVLLQSGRTID